MQQVVPASAHFKGFTASDSGSTAKCRVPACILRPAVVGFVPLKTHLKARYTQLSLLLNIVTCQHLCVMPDVYNNYTKLYLLSVPIAVLNAFKKRRYHDTVNLLTGTTGVHPDLVKVCCFICPNYE